MFEPTAIAGAKYGGKGMFSVKSFKVRLPNHVKAALATMANHGLSDNTWKTYNSAMSQLEKCQQHYKRTFAFPMSSDDILLFVTYLVHDKNLKANSVEVYISALRQIHLAKGYVIKELRPDLVKAILSGKKNMDVLQRKSCDIRLPVTINMLKLLKLELNNVEGQKGFRKLIWAVSTICFFGALRIHEILSRQVSNFDPINTLLGQDLKIRTIRMGNEKVRVIQIKIKSPKESRCVKDKIIDIYENGGKLCPVRALENWLRTAPPIKKGLPFFRLADGTPLTGRKLNDILRVCFKKHIPKGKGFVSSHSFRGGMASLMGLMGYSDEDIMAVGRWSSQCFETYMKLPRTKRLKMAREMGNWEL